MGQEFEISPHTDHNSNFPTESDYASLKFASEVTPAMVRHVLTSNFTDIDTNKNNLLSQQELDSFKPKPSQLLVKEYSKRSFHELTRAHNASLFGDGQISKTDLVQYEIRHDPNLSAVQERYNKYADLFEDNFEIIDTSKDKKVSVEELDAARNNQQLDVGARQMVQFFRDNYDAVALKACHHSNQLGKSEVYFSKQWLDFNSTLSQANELQYFGAGAVLGGIGSALSIGASLTMKLGRFPGWQAIGIAAAVGGLAYGGYMAWSGHQQSKHMQVSRAHLWNSISAELASEGAPDHAPPVIIEEGAPGNTPHVVIEGSGQRGKSAAKSLLENL